MNKLMQTILKFLSSRLFRNILFWVFASSVIVNNSQPGYPYNTVWYYLFICISAVILLTLTYTNNLLLVPKLLVKRKFVGYFSSALVLTIILALLQTLTIKMALTRFPVLKVQQVSFISSPVSSTWTMSTITEETTSYIFGFSLWVFVFTMAWYMNDYNRQQKTTQRAVKKQVETELTFLKEQMNPHFLLNTLNNLYGLALIKSDKAPEAILQLSNILRYFLYESNVELISFDKEKKLMHAYIDLELLRLSNRDHLTFFIDADNTYNIPPLLWLPVLENIFKHGTRYIADEYFIDYKFIIYNHQLSIRSKNKFKPTTVKDEDGGIGLTNLKKRLEILYPGKHSIVLDTVDNIYSININIQLT
ncbi:MAG: sensor histidine kinase [Flavipsychrobacter sp.]|nr:sensor histidine kinase [Flavipsychrobacter sp.]